MPGVLKKIDRTTLYRALNADGKIDVIFLSDWWLDATAGVNNWDVALVEQDGAIVAALPFVLSERRGLTFLGQPGMTQFLGPWLDMRGVGERKILSRQKSLLSDLADALPYFDSYSQNWSRNQTNWLPFYWKGFSQTTRYTYVIPDLSDISTVWSGFQSNIKTDIRKAQGRYNLSVRSDLDIEVFLELNKQVFDRQGMKVPYSEEYIRRIDSACSDHQCKRMFIAEDPDGNRHAGAYIVWDDNSAYYLMGGGDPKLRNSGATSLCIWEAIKFVSSKTKQFDFEGSMIEPVERYFRAFGAEQRPYFNISKTRSKLLRVYGFLRDIRKPRI